MILFVAGFGPTWYPWDAAEGQPCQGAINYDVKDIAFCAGIACCSLTMQRCNVLGLEKGVKLSASFWKLENVLCVFFTKKEINEAVVRARIPFWNGL